MHGRGRPCNTGKLIGWASVKPTGRPRGTGRTRWGDGGAGSTDEAGNAGGGKRPWFRSAQDIARDWRLGTRNSESIRSYRRRCMPKRRVNPAFVLLTVRQGASSRCTGVAYAAVAPTRCGWCRRRAFRRHRGVRVERWLGELTDTLKRRPTTTSAQARVRSQTNGKLRPCRSPRSRQEAMMAATLILAPIFEADLPAEQHGIDRNAVRSQRCRRHAICW